MLKLNKKIEKYIISYRKKNRRFPEISEISEKFNITEEGIREILKARDAIQVVSIDQNNRVYDSYHYPRLNKIKSKDYQSFKLPIEDIISLKIAISKLKKIQQKVLHYIFEKDLTQSKIAYKLGISQRQVSRIKESAIKELKETINRE